jgi:hypothetical protein
MNMNMNTSLLIGISCITGILGDSMLQLGAANGLGGPTGWGLNDYFKQHGSMESIFIAGGMMVIFYLIFMASGVLLNVQMTFVSLAVYGVLLDLLFRKAMVFRSLDGYYKYFNYFWSAVWGAIPMMMPLLFYKLSS